MATVITTTQANPNIYPGHDRVDWSMATGHLWVLTINASGNLELHVSTDNGGSWTLADTLVRSGIQDAALYIPPIGHIHVVYRTNESSQDRIYWRKYFPSSDTWSGEVLLSAVANGGVAGAIYRGLNVIVVGAYGADYVAVAVGIISGANHGVVLLGGHTTAAGAMRVEPGTFAGPTTYVQPGSGRIGPTLDISHIGDGKTANVPHLWVTFGRGRINVFSCGWTGWGWSTPSSSWIMVSSVPAQNSIRGSFDGRRFICASANPNSTSTVAVYERNASHTGSTTTRVTPTHPTGVIRSCTIAYDYANDDFRVFAVGTSTAVLYYTTYDRSAGTFSSWTAVVATAVLGVVPENYSVRRNNGFNSRYDTVISHSGSPNTVVHYPVTQAYTPAAPTWLIDSGIARDVAATLLLDWQFNDADPADVQTAYALSRQIGAGALAYWRASDSTWQAAEVKNLSSTTAVTLASSWAAASDANYTYRVKVWDNTDLPSVYSSSLIVVPSAKANPTITSPTPAQVIAGDTITVTWTVSEQTAYRVRLFDTTAGGNVVHDSTFVGGSSLTYEIPYTLKDANSWTVGVTTRNNEGLESTEIYQGFTTDFVEPAVPTFTFTPTPASGYMRVVFNNPVPGGGQPAVLSQELWRRAVGDTGDGVRVGINISDDGTVDDWRIPSRTASEYRALVRGVNGASIWTSWTP